MTLDPNILAALSTMPEALASYIQSQTAAPAPAPMPAPITQAPVAPPVDPTIAWANSPYNLVQPTNEIVIPLTEVVKDRPKKPGFGRFVDARVNLPTVFDHKTDAVRFSKLFISPLTLLMYDEVEIVIRRKAK